MRSSTDVPEYLAIARIREIIEPDSSFLCTARGSALDELTCPIEGKLFLPHRLSDRSSSATIDAQPGDSSEDLAPSFLGPGGGRFLPITLISHRARKHHRWVRIQLHQAPGVDTLVGAWVCVHHSLLERTGDVFFYQLRHLPVRRAPTEAPVGRVTDYLETGAHGVIVVESTDGPEVMLPLGGEFVTIDLEAGEVIVPAFDDFV